MDTAPLPHISVQREDFDLAHEVSVLTAGRSDIGAVVSFTGLCRDEGGTLAALELEHYPGMAEAEIGRIAEEAARRWPLTGLRIIHRHGKIQPGENIVLVVTASAHRQAAFEAASFLMDFLKTRAPFWKKEHRRDGAPSAGSGGGWVEAKALDDEAESRWTAGSPQRDEKP
ncbi:molybdenum cofactor biosynthesis protein MoaE [Brucella endophytica]|uniref:Molybdopterin synthase catalytic subunit n=1 Tax=Brucella endophytica TaxID=1963359 RepID=A0A916WFG1_9HYPH|nr:molybdenum cofactor biosynthesis protein MoaE [Brucella endophytica]GGA92620.1 molybdenum cofactor biosynthesis protein MoaE [Brucella endophytica]